MEAHGDRDYDAAAALLRGLRTGDRAERMQAVVDALWPALSARAVSWIGFYTKAIDPARGHEMILAARRDKPACSPIGMHGACGRCWSSRRALIVTDVARLGEGYIACDPRDRSEVVLPLLETDGSCWGVLDLDSYDVAAFNPRDVAGLQHVIEAAGLSPAADWTDRTDVV